LHILTMVKNLPIKYDSPQREKSKHIESIFSGVAGFWIILAAIPVGLIRRQNFISNN